MIRAAIGVVAVVGSYVIHPALAVGMGAVALVWFLLGLAAVIHRAAEQPDTDVPVRPAPPPPPTPRAAEIECPKCSLFVPTDAAACTCGWIVPDAA